MKSALKLLRDRPNCNISKVAKMYNIPRTTLRRMLIREGIDYLYKRPIGRPATYQRVIRMPK